MDAVELANRLQEPFDAKDIEWRIQQAGVTNGKPWVMAIPYITSRAVQTRLDDVFGPFGWGNEFKPTPDGKGWLCGISIHMEDKTVIKWDGSEHTGIEPLKGALSGSEKRAAVQWGIGRYLYRLDVAFAICWAVSSRRDSQNNYHYDKTTGTHVDWADPELPNWALPGIEAGTYLEKIKSATTLGDLQLAYDESYLFAKAFNRHDFLDKFQKAFEKTTEKLHGEAADQVEARLSEVSAWLDNQLNNISLVPNESAVKTVGNRIKDQLKEKCTGQYFDKKPLLEKLNKVVIDRITLLNEKNKSEK